MTTPATCAVAVCDPVKRSCSFHPLDQDGDGHFDVHCVGQGVLPGDDCNDSDPAVYPGAWDGPAGADANGKTESNACDTKDNDCNGAADDGALANGTSCTCAPGASQACNQDANGNAVTFPTGKPVGSCKAGTQICTDTNGKGQWGQCIGTVTPLQFDNCSVTNDDSNCNGVASEGCTCSPGETATCGQKLGSKGACAAGTTVCQNNQWGPCNVTPQPHDTCDPGNDADCDGTPNDGSPTGATDWTQDGDGDGYVRATATVINACVNPGNATTNNAYTNCNDTTKPCPANWSNVKKAAYDCNDTDANVHPGAWDGPMVGYGITPPGITANVFYFSPSSTNLPALPSSTPPSSPALTISSLFSLDYDWGSRGVFFPDSNGKNQLTQPNDVVIYFSGTLRAPTTGAYTFQTVTDDGVRLYVGSMTSPVIDNWTLHAATKDMSTSVNLTAGTDVPIVLVYFQAANNATCILNWAGPGFGQTNGVGGGGTAGAGMSAFAPIPLTSWSSDADATTTTVDRCDTLDNDCNGIADDAVAAASDGSHARRCGAPCVPGAERSCGATTGVCLNGVNGCDAATDQWVSTCIGQVQPAAGGCDCRPGDTRSCTANACAGSNVCNNGTWSTQCYDNTDKSTVLTASCQCTVNQTKTCTSGVCGGIQHCVSQSWSPCEDASQTEIPSNANCCTNGATNPTCPNGKGCSGTQTCDSYHFGACTGGPSNCPTDAHWSNCQFSFPKAYDADVEATRAPANDQSVAILDANIPNTVPGVPYSVSVDLTLYTQQQCSGNNDPYGWIYCGQKAGDGKPPSDGSTARRVKNSDFSVGGHRYVNLTGCLSGSSVWFYRLGSGASGIGSPACAHHMISSVTASVPADCSKGYGSGGL